MLQCVKRAQANEERGVRAGGMSGAALASWQAGRWVWGGCWLRPVGPLLLGDDLGYAGRLRSQGWDEANNGGVGLCN